MEENKISTTPVVVTIFTPTFNRGYIIEKLYHTLQRQTSTNFEWIVVDDGSSDNTEQLFQQWLAEDNNFTITYKKVENGGKHRAINIGTDLAKGLLFFIVDSDDYISDDAVETIIQMEQTIHDKEGFAGVSGLRMFFDGHIVGGVFSSSLGQYVDATNLERKKYNLLGDKAEVYYTKVLKKHKFPEFEGETFLTEAIVGNRIARDGYKLRWFSKGLYFCEYLEDGLSHNIEQVYKRNPQGHMLYFRENFSDFSLYEKLSATSLYVTLCGAKKVTARSLNVSLLFVHISMFARTLHNIKKRSKTKR